MPHTDTHSGIETHSSNSCGAPQASTVHKQARGDKVVTLLKLAINQKRRGRRSREEHQVAGEKCGWCTFVRTRRRNWVGNKPLGLALTVVAKLKPWMLRSNPGSASYPCASRSRESSFVPSVLDVWNCITSYYQSTLCALLPSPLN